MSVALANASPCSNIRFAEGRHAGVTEFCRRLPGPQLQRAAGLEQSMALRVAPAVLRKGPERKGHPGRWNAPSRPAVGSRYPDAPAPDRCCPCTRGECWRRRGFHWRVCRCGHADESRAPSGLMLAQGRSSRGTVVHTRRARAHQRRASPDRQPAAPAAPSGLRTHRRWWRPPHRRCRAIAPLPPPLSSQFSWRRRLNQGRLSTGTGGLSALARRRVGKP